MSPINDSTDAYAQTRFPLHGRVQIVGEWPFLLNHSEGPFNKELVLALGQLLAAQIPALQARGPWVMLAIIGYSTLATDEALQTFAGMLQRLSATGLAPRAVAHVTSPEVEGAGLMDEAIARCFDTAGIPFASFSEEAPARDWLQSQLGSD
ncbi:hypothetical protein H5407_11340 [Mitsuaria sp. WAJ17]|uniref:hypothetical protein n=1 Tax=Mitsuaria sp. WAJ17 TaxID=2761452 RepID=UPI001603672D|nr:hypothetical protein [Mitsuaria sp. WAJ17]MBB2485814.1 hypothetical protein [Mitsuaria sp. WAJ17]